MSDYQNFSSLPPEKERDFIIYEKTSVEASQKAMRIGTIVAVCFGVVVVAIVLAIGGKPHNKMADDDLGMLKRADDKKKAEKAAPKPDKPASDSSGAAADTPDEAGGDADKAEGDKAEGDKAEAAEGDEDKAE